MLPTHWLFRDDAKYFTVKADNDAQTPTKSHVNS